MMHYDVLSEMANNSELDSDIWGSSKQGCSEVGLPLGLKEEQLDVVVAGRDVFVVHIDSMYVINMCNPS